MTLSEHVYRLSFQRIARFLGQWLGLVALGIVGTSALLVLPAFFFSRLPWSLAMTPIMLILLPALLLGVGVFPFLLLGCWLVCRLFCLRLTRDGVSLALGPYRREMLWLEVKRLSPARVLGMPCVLVEGLARDSQWRIPTGLMHHGERLAHALLAFTPRPPAFPEALEAAESLIEPTDAEGFAED